MATFHSGRRNPPNLDLTGTEAGEHATRAGAGRLLLTHPTSWTDPEKILGEARGSYDGPASIVASGDSYDI